MFEGIMQVLTEMGPLQVIGGVLLIGLIVLMFTHGKGNGSGGNNNGGGTTPPPPPTQQ